MRTTVVPGSRTTFTYDGDGRRTNREIFAGTSAAYLWDDWNTMELIGLGTLIDHQRYTYEPANYGKLISAIDDQFDGTLYHHFDGLGSTDRVTDTFNNVINSNVYDAYGNIRASTGSATPFKYVSKYGYYYDGGNTQYYVRQRYYQSTMARWLSSARNFYSVKSPNRLSSKTPGIYLSPNSYVFYQNDP